MRLKIFTSLDYLLLLCILFLTGIGIAFIYSSGFNSDGINVSNEYIKQIIWLGVGLVLLVLVALFDYRRLNKYSFHFFAFMLAVLIYTRFFGRLVNGARSWIGIGDFGIQPSELTKISFILFLAKYLENSMNEEPRKRFIHSLCIMGFPVGIILLQPDLGTASVFIPIFLFMCFMANIPVRYLMIVFLTGMFTITFTVLPVWETEILHESVPAIHILTNLKLRMLVSVAFLGITTIGVLGNLFFKKKYYYWITYFFGILSTSLFASVGAGKVLKPYQIARLIVFIDPYSDPKGSGWNIIQSQTAIGAGGLLGRGFLQGSQSHLRFLPQQSTDFIFSIFSEEMGFVGGIFMYAAFLCILLRILYVIKQTTNNYSCYIASGILGMFFFHFIVNVGMVMGIMPITGIPLPFMSYGGSALITNMIALGLIMSINSRRLDFKSTF
ncbi:MAG: rod shape-determining protein RodA [Spirochaetia bacterium]|nr:rod shape-determining protein RodA [uncultured Treponema sp.]MCI7397157.1 rod shape-determining protein RodA [Spirochaetia bacterium]MCI7576649.1 rod shape-determining protein RodA [Spirochaetia bacterium]